MMPPRELQPEHTGTDVLTVQPPQRKHPERVLVALPLQEQVDIGVGRPKCGEILDLNERHVDADQIDRNEHSQCHDGPERGEPRRAEAPGDTHRCRGEDHRDHEAPLDERRGVGEDQSGLVRHIPIDRPGPKPVQGARDHEHETQQDDARSDPEETPRPSPVGFTTASLEVEKPFDTESHQRHRGKAEKENGE